MDKLMVSVQVARTRVYRLVLWAAQLAAAALLIVDRWGPGVGLTPFDIGLLDTIFSSLVLAGRQITDHSTPSLPSPGPVVLPAPGIGGPPSP